MQTTEPSPAGVTRTNPDGLYDPAPFGYSHLGEIPAGRRLVCVAGQGGERPDGTRDPGFAAQVAQALDNVVTALGAAGATPADVAKLIVLIVDHDEAKLPILGREFNRIFGDGLKPACTLIPVPRLALQDMLFEVEAVAAVAG